MPTAVEESAWMRLTVTVRSCLLHVWKLCVHEHASHTCPPPLLLPDSDVLHVKDIRHLGLVARESPFAFNDNSGGEALVHLCEGIQDGKSPRGRGSSAPLTRTYCIIYRIIRIGIRPGVYSSLPYTYTCVAHCTPYSRHHPQLACKGGFVFDGDKIRLHTVEYESAESAGAFCAGEEERREGQEGCVWARDGGGRERAGA
jgi:hypothetical protein